MAMQRTHLKSFLKNLKINRSVFFKSCMTARVNLMEKMSYGHSITIKLAFRLGGGGGNYQSRPCMHTSFAL